MSEENKKNTGRADYFIDYSKKNIKRVPLDVPVNYYEDYLKPAAEKENIPVNKYIKEAVEFRMRFESFSKYTPYIDEETCEKFKIEVVKEVMKEYQRKSSTKRISKYVEKLSELTKEKENGDQ